MNSRKGPVLLLVDDNEDLRNMTAALLGQYGYRIVDAPDPQDGLRLVQSSKCLDVLISDFRMPYMKGDEFVRQARTIHPGLKVIFITGFAKELASSWVPDANTKLITKPFRIEHLIDVIDELTSTSSHAGQPVPH
jgi:CheY-like chemotaxis protein